MQGRLFLDVVIRKSAAIFHLFACKEEPLLVRGDAFFILDLGIQDILGVTGLHLQGDGLAGQGLHEDLHITPQTQGKKEREKERERRKKGKRKEGRKEERDGVNY